MPSNEGERTGRLLLRHSRNGVARLATPIHQLSPRSEENLSNTAPSQAPIRRKVMQGMGNTDEACPFKFNFDPGTFKVGDLVSYRVPDAFGGGH